MGSVIDVANCPHCGEEAWVDFYYKTGEEYVTCNSCGYYKSVTMIDREKPLSEADNWKIYELANPFGAFRIKLINEVGTTCGSLADEDQYNSLKEDVTKRDDVQFAVVSRFIDGAIKLEAIVGGNQQLV
jgi:Zn ribbon nucleic-acid-binding protein